jgi:hypothetical protein
VVIGGNLFQTVPVRRNPEFVALSSPHNSMGVFELDGQPDMLLPFEGSGVEMTWEFSMPKAANRFDYRTIAHVLITLEYTSLNSVEYRQQVLQSLKSSLSADPQPVTVIVRPRCSRKSTDSRPSRTATWREAPRAGPCRRASSRTPAASR